MTNFEQLLFNYNYYSYYMELIALFQKKEFIWIFALWVSYNKEFV